MNGEVRQVPDDEEGREIWRLITDDETRDVSAERIDGIDGWRVVVDMMLIIREEPLEGDLHRGVTAALRLVQGVDAAEEEDRESWLVTGTPDPTALIRYAAWAVDSLTMKIEEEAPGRARRSATPPPNGDR